MSAAPLPARSLEKVVGETNFFANAVWDHTTRSALVVPTLATVCAGVLISASPWVLSTGHVSLGEVLAALQAVDAMGAEGAQLFETLVEIQLAVSALLKITHHLNLPTDVNDRLVANRWRRKQGRIKRELARTALQARARADVNAAPAARAPARQPGGLPAKRRAVSTAFSSFVAAAATNAADAVVGAALAPEVDSRSYYDPDGGRERAGGARRSCFGSTTKKRAPSISLSLKSAPRLPPRLAAAAMAGDEGLPTLTTDAQGKDGERPESVRFAADMVDIELQDVSLVHPSDDDLGEYRPWGQGPSEEEPSSSAASLAHVTMRIRQGRIVAVVGGPSSGKASLLRVIAGHVLPTSGDVFTPPHLTVLHVEQQPQLMGMSLLDNLWIGVRGALDVDGLERVCEICRSLGLPPEFVERLNDTFALSYAGLSRLNLLGRAARRLSVASVHAWQRNLTVALSRDVEAEEVPQVGHGLPTSHAALLHLARALISDPEVLVLHRPTALLDEAVARNLLLVLRRFVQERGLAMPTATLAMRRLRTVIFSCGSLAQALEVADDVCVMDWHTKSAQMYVADDLRADEALRARVADGISAGFTRPDVQGAAPDDAPGVEQGLLA